MIGKGPAAPAGGATEGETERLSPSSAVEAQTAGLLRAGQVLADRYVVSERIGKGGASLVYRAFDRGLQVMIAIKVLDTERWAGTLPEPLFRELRHAREIQHPHLCRIYDVVRAEAGGPQFLTMELAEGGNLRDTLIREPDRPLSQRLADVQGVVSGLAALHAAGILHRDVKPENVLRMGDGRVVLSDFGLAVAPDRVTHVTGGVGTPVYMAPELRLGAPADFRADVWSLGLLIQEIVFGVRAAPERATAAAGLTAGERRLRDRMKALSAWCLHVEADQRPADARQVLARFQRLDQRRWLPLGHQGRRRALWGGLAALALVAVGFALRPRPASNPPDAVIDVALEGRARPLADRVRQLTEVEGRVHCLTALADGSLGVVWGQPRRADKLLPGSRALVPWDVPARAYDLPPSDFPDPLDNKCPQMAPDGKRLLYWGLGAGNQPAVFLQDDVGAPPTLLTGGSMPIWHPSGELLALRVDEHHPGLFNLKNRHLTVLPKPRQNMLIVSQLTFDGSGRHLLVRSVDGAAGYAVSRYALDNIPRVEGVLVRRAQDTAEHIVRLNIGAALGSEQLLHAMMPSGAYGLAALDWDHSRVRWLAQFEPLDITGSLTTADGRLVVLARRWTSDLQVLRDGQVIRTIVADGPAGGSAASATGDVAAQMDRGGRVVIVLYRVGEAQPRLLGAGPLDGGPSFSPDGRSVLFGRGDPPRGRDLLILCTLEGVCRTLGAIPNTSDYPRLSPSGDRVAHVGWNPYPHIAMLDLRSGSSRMLVPSLGCAPHWLGGNVWAAQGSSEQFSWVELDATSGQATGRTVAGKSGCGAVSPGPEGVLEQRLRVVHRETSRLLAVQGDVR